MIVLLLNKRHYFSIIWGRLYVVGILKMCGQTFEGFVVGAALVLMVLPLMNVNACSNFVVGEMYLYPRK